MDILSDLSKNYQRWILLGLLSENKLESPIPITKETSSKQLQEIAKSLNLYTQFNESIIKIITDFQRNKEENKEENMEENKDKNMDENTERISLDIQLQKKRRIEEIQQVSEIDEMSSVVTIATPYTLNFSQERPQQFQTSIPQQFRTSIPQQFRTSDTILTPDANTIINPYTIITPCNNPLQPLIKQPFEVFYLARYLHLIYNNSEGVVPIPLRDLIVKAAQTATQTSSMSQINTMIPSLSDLITQIYDELEHRELDSNLSPFQKLMTLKKEHYLMQCIDNLIPSWLVNSNQGPILNFDRNRKNKAYHDKYNAWHTMEEKYIFPLFTPVLTPSVKLTEYYNYIFNEFGSFYGNINNKINFIGSTPNETHRFYYINTILGNAYEKIRFYMIPEEDTRILSILQKYDPYNNGYISWEANDIYFLRQMCDKLIRLNFLFIDNKFWAGWQINFINELSELSYFLDFITHNSY